MTDHAPLTDKELAKLPRATCCSCVRRLIADLRAARAEVERMRERNQFLEAVLKKEGYTL